MYVTDLIEKLQKIANLFPDTEVAVMVPNRNALAEYSYLEIDAIDDGQRSSTVHILTESLPEKDW